MNNDISNLGYYIRYYDDVLTLEECQKYIDQIEAGQRSAGKVSDFNTIDGSSLRSNIKKSEDLNMSRQYPNEVPFVLGKVEDYLSRYQADIKMKVPFFQTGHIVGRVYRKNDGEYKTHVDAASPTTVDRVMTMLFYLNDLQEGGEITFPKIGVTIKPKAGRLVMFPPFWFFHHKANKSTLDDRYLLRVFVSGANFDVRQHACYYKALEDAENKTNNGI